MGEFKILDLEVHGDQRGSLISIESNKNIPFTLKRIYYLFNTNVSESRGFHAHRNLEQLLICVNGSCEIKVQNNEKTSWFKLASPAKGLYIKDLVWREMHAWFKLASPAKGLYIKDLVWREMHDFSHDCILLVIASHEYDEFDYIRSFNEFKRIMNNG